MQWKYAELDWKELKLKWIANYWTLRNWTTKGKKLMINNFYVNVYKYIILSNQTKYQRIAYTYIYIYIYLKILMKFSGKKKEFFSPTPYF